MIELPTYPLNMAAKKIGCTEAELIHLAASAKLRIYAQLAGKLSIRGWTNIHTGECSERESVIIDRLSLLPECLFYNYDPNKSIKGYSVFPHDGDVEEGVYNQLLEDFPLGKLQLLILAEDMERLKPDKQEYKNIIRDNPNQSEQLRNLIIASQMFWADANRDDKSTWRDTDEEIIPWLIIHGFSKSLAERAASIIRPEWAGPGAKPK